MASNSEFWKKYRHPNWQRMRLQILERDGFECQQCGDTDSELHVHHAYYERDLDPWEYPADSLLTVCKPCHQILENMRLEMRRCLGTVSSTHWDEIKGFIRGVRMRDDDDHESHAVTWESYEEAVGVAAAHLMSVEDLFAMARDQPLTSKGLRDWHRRNQLNDR